MHKYTATEVIVILGCGICKKRFDTERQLNGHIGGKHKRVPPIGDIKHKTPNGYKAHRRRGEEACDDCKAAWAERARNVRSSNS